MMNLKSTFFALVTVGVLGFLLTSCDDHRLYPENPEIGGAIQIPMVATLSGAAERPTSVVSDATGSFVGVLNRTTRVLSYTVTYSAGLKPVAGHLHRINNNVTGTGPVEIGLASLGSPIIGTTTLTTKTRVDSLINGFYYVNLHTAAFPGGEIRGNVRVDGRIGLDASLSGAAEKPTPVNSMGTGTFFGVVDPATRVLSYTVTYSGLTPTSGHLHRITNAATGTGGVEIPFASLPSPIIGTATLMNKNRVDSLLNGFYYVNLHTPANLGGEIRGDIR